MATTIRTMDSDRNNYDAGSNSCDGGSNWCGSDSTNNTRLQRWRWQCQQQTQTVRRSSKSCGTSNGLATKYSYGYSYWVWNLRPASLPLLATGYSYDATVLSWVLVPKKAITASSSPYSRSWIFSCHHLPKNLPLHIRSITAKLLFLFLLLTNTTIATTELS